MREAIRSVLARGATFPITAVCTALSTWLIIDYAGSVAFGAVSLIATLFMLLPFADLGLGATIINRISATENAHVQSRVMSAGARLLLLPAAVMIAAATVLGLTVDWAGLLNIKSIPAPSVQVAVTACLIIFAVSIPMSVGQRTLVGLQRNHVAVLVSATSSIAMLIVVLVCIALRVDAALISVAQPMGVLCSASCATLIASRLLSRARSLASGTSQLTRDVRWDFSMFRTAGPAVIVMVGLPLAFQTQRVFLSIRSTPEDLAEYALAMQLYTPLWSFISVAAMSLWPIFAARRAGLAVEEARGLVRRATISFGAFGAIGLGGFVILGDPLASLLSNGTISLSLSTCAAFGALVAVQAIQQVPGMFLTSTKGMWIQAGCITAMAIWTVIASWVVAPLGGAAAVTTVLVVGVLAFQAIPGHILVGLTRKTMV